MRLLILADIHGDVKRIPELIDEASKSDAVVLAGDITNFGEPRHLAVILDELERFGKPIIAVCGNCDPPVIDQELERRKYSVHANAIFLDDYAFVGAGGSLPCPGSTPNEAGESVFKDILEETVTMAEGKTLILVTHQPAWGTKLDIAGQRHTGSKSIRDFIEKYQPVLAVSGHMHEAFGTDRIGATTLVNPGPFRNGRYAVAEIAGKEVKEVQLKTQG